MTWNVLLIGGPSSVGKSTAARTIARQRGATWLQIDDVRLALQRSPAIPIGSDAATVLKFFEDTPDVWSWPIDRLRDAFIGIGEILTPSLDIIVKNHVAIDAPIVIEGDGLLPDLLDDETITSFSQHGSVRAVFVIPEKAGTIRDNLVARGWGTPHMTAAAVERSARAKWAFGQWLKGEATRRNVPVITPEPYGTLVERIEILRPRNEGST